MIILRREYLFAVKCEFRGYPAWFLCPFGQAYDDTYKKGFHYQLPHPRKEWDEFNVSTETECTIQEEFISEYELRHGSDDSKEWLLVPRALRRRANK